MEKCTGFLDGTVTAGGHRRRYAVHLPIAYNPRTPWPVILFLHGRGESGDDGRRQLAQGLAPAIMDRHEAWPFVVVFPQKADGARAWVDEGELLVTLLARIEERYRIDRTRCHLTGLSQGGHGTIALAARLPWRFASLAPVCGAAVDVEAAARAVGATPFWSFHGDDDPVVPVARSIELVEAIGRRGGNARLTRYPGVGHASWQPAYHDDDLPRWMLDQRATL